MRLTEAVEPLITKDVMDAQLDQYTRKRPAELVVGAPPKRECLVAARRKVATNFNRQLNTTYIEEGAAACKGMQMEAQIYGPCHCVACCGKTSVTVPQVRFVKQRRDGFVETSNLYKEYRAVINKRWAFPNETKTWPFGFKH